MNVRLNYLNFSFETFLFILYVMLVSFFDEDSWWSERPACQKLNPCIPGWATLQYLNGFSGSGVAAICLLQVYATQCLSQNSVFQSGYLQN